MGRTTYILGLCKKLTEILIINVRKHAQYFNYSVVVRTTAQALGSCGTRQLKKQLPGYSAVEKTTAGALGSCENNCLGTRLLFVQISWQLKQLFQTPPPSVVMKN